MKWRKIPKLSFNWGFLELRSSPRLLKPNLPNLRVDIQKLAAGTGTSVQQKLHTLALRAEHQFCHKNVAWTAFLPQYYGATR